MEHDDYLTIGPASRLLCVSPEYLRTLDRKGVLPAIRSGQLRLFKRSEVEALRSQREEQRFKSGR